MLFVLAEVSMVDPSLTTWWRKISTYLHRWPTHSNHRLAPYHPFRIDIRLKKDKERKVCFQRDAFPLVTWEIAIANRTVMFIVVIVVIIRVRIHRLLIGRRRLVIGEGFRLLFEDFLSVFGESLSFGLFHGLGVVVVVTVDRGEWRLGKNITDVECSSTGRRRMTWGFDRWSRCWWRRIGWERRRIDIAWWKNAIG